METPILFIQGEQDSERLLEGFQRLREAAPQHRFEKLAGANHTFGTVHPFDGTTDELEQAIALTGEFFSGLLGRDCEGIS
ncbi:fermentation-respiration switch protein FrsA (DUF1100 family) [Paenibacillus castaneae]|uniref:hypothetical protein n=1 Tax=Paenibacillus castaneae TaxID=474957 RepID=UPI001FB91661|nr:hypothetical protein [Paenibacillus castaneae]NIK78089.1 fermentation-respiration switch protein FrsA (DUF1100 family) [Paenibacillus castaneae]